MNKNKLYSLILISLFVVTMIYFNPETLTDLKEEKQVNEQLIDTKPIDSVIVPPTRSVIDYDQWYLSSSILMDIEFNKQTVDFETLMVESADAYNPITYVQELQRYGVYTDDSTDYYIIWEINTPDTLPICYVYLDIYCGGSGELITDQQLSIRDTSPINRYSADIINTFTVNSNYLDAEGYLHLMWYAKASSSTETLWLYLYYIDPLGAMTSIYTHSEVVDAFVSVATMRLVSDRLYFIRETITNNVKTTYKYNSPTSITHSVNPPGVTFAKEMNIYYNEDRWTYSSITPYASVTDTGGVLTINSPTEIDYEVLFTEKNNNHLAIRDVSTSYFSDLGFEGGTTDSYINWVTNPFETFETSTEQSFAGYSSLKTVQDSGTYGIAYVALPNDYYYVDCWAYIDSITGGAEEVSITWWDGSAWNYEYFDPTIIDRWQHLQFYMQIIGDSSGRNFELVVESTTATVYFDYESLLFQTSTTIETFGYSESEISSSLLSWDGYKNPVMPYEILYLELWDRTAQTLEESYSTITNEYGVATWTLEKGLEQKEYELRVYSLDSYFGSEQTQTDVTNSLTDWILQNEDVGTETASCVDSSIVFEFRESVSVNWEVRYDPTALFDISSSDILYYTYRSNVTSQLNYKWIRTDASNYILNQTNQDFSADTIYHMIDSFRHADYVETGSFDDSSIDNIYLRASLPLGWIKIEIFDFRFINTQKLFFTPSLPTHTDYAETVLGDAWDWTEGDDDSWVAQDLEVYTIENGLAVAETNALTSSDGINSYTDYAITNDFNTVFIRVQANRTQQMMYWIQTDVTARGAYFTVTTSWTIFEIDLSAWIGEEVTETRIQTTTTGAPIKIEFDYLQFIHKDSWFEETNDYATDELFDSWDFEEGDTEDWVNEHASLNWACENGHLRFETSAGYGYTLIRTDFLVDFDLNYDYIIIRAKINDTTDTPKLKPYQNGGSTNTDYKYMTTDYATYVWDISSLSWSGDYQIVISFDQIGVWTVNMGFEIDYIRFVHLEEMPYETIQNSVLLESETNDLQYNLWLEHNYIGTFSDLSLIPLPQTAGTHYISVQPFKTDGPYSTQQIFSYYYTVEADSFSVNIESFYLSDLYVNTFVKSNYDYSYYVYEDNDPAGSGTGYKEGTAISSNRDTTEGVTIAYALKFVYASETAWFNTSYSNSRSAFYVESYTIDIQAENIQIIWSTTKPTIDSLTVYEGTDLEVDAEASSPSSWVKSTVVGIHYVMLIFEAVSYSSIIYYFTYEIVSEVFEVNVESFHLSELFVNTYITASENGNYQVYENNTIVGSEGSLQSIGTSIQTDRNITEGAFINYAIKFWNTDLDEIWFNTTYSNTEGDFFVSDYSVNIAETTITITWATSLPDSDSLTVKEDGANKVDDESSPSDWTKSTVVGTHAVVLLFEADGYATITYSFNYYVYAVADFQVDIGSFQVSDDYVNTYASANYDGNYFVYEDNDQIETGLFYGAGTAIETTRDTTAGVTIAYAIKFIYESTTIWFNTTYSNPVTPFYLTDYRVEDGTTITVTWDTTLPALDSLTIYEDGVLIEDSDPESTTTWLKSTVVGNHYVTLIFSAEGYTDIIHSFSYTVYPPTAFTIYIETFYVSDDYLNIYLTATHDYSYTVYENGTEKGSGTGIASGTTIISPKNRAAGLYNFTVIFTYESTNKSFMTWYSNLIPPLHPLNDLYRTDSQGFYNISLYTNLEFFWVDVWHDSVLIIDDSTETRYSIPKALKVGLHNITLIYRYNVSTDGEGYPITAYNETIAYEFWYETKLFYDIRIRYVPVDYIGLMIGDAFEVSWVHTYFNGELIFDGEIDDVPDYSNYTFIANDYIRIRNNMPIHNLTITDLFGRVIMYNLTIDISSFAYAIIELPVYRLGVVNNDDESHKISIRPYLSGEDWQTTPILPPGYQTEYWVCNRTYEIRILSVGSTTYDENGAMVGLYDDITDYPELRTVPYVIVIPLDLVFEPEEEEVVVKWWTTPLFIGCMAGAALIIILVAIYIVNKNVKKKERLNK